MKQKHSHLNLPLYIMSAAQLAPYSLQSKVEHYIGNRALFDTRPYRVHLNRPSAVCVDLHVPSLLLSLLSLPILICLLYCLLSPSLSLISIFISPPHVCLSQSLYELLISVLWVPCECTLEWMCVCGDGCTSFILKSPWSVIYGASCGYQTVPHTQWYTILMVTMLSSQHHHFLCTVSL